MIDDETILFQGKEFKIIGVQKIHSLIVPFNSLAEDTPIDAFLIHFIKPVTRSQYNETKEKVSANFGELAVIPELDIPETENYYLYNTIIIISVLIAVLASINFDVLYKYILSKRIKTLAIFRMCGCTKLVFCVLTSYRLAVISRVEQPVKIIPQINASIIALFFIYFTFPEFLFRQYCTELVRKMRSQILYKASMRLCAVLPLYYIVIISYRKDDLFLFFGLLHTSPHRYLYERHNFSERIIRLFFITAIDKYDIWGYNIDVLINSTDLTKTLRRVKIRALSVDRTGSCRSDEKHRCLRFVFCIPLHKT